MIEKNNVFKMSVLHSEPAGNCSKAHKTELFIEMECRVICGNNGVKLHKAKTEFRSFFERMADKRFAEMFSSAIEFYSITCVGNVSASSDVVRVKDIEPDRSTRFRIKGDSGKILCLKNFSASFGKRASSCGKATPSSTIRFR